MKKKSFIQQGIEQYKKLRVDGDIDVIDSIRQLLIDNGLSEKVKLHYDTDEELISGTDKNSSSQIFLLNRYWGFQFLKLEDTENICTQSHRFCLSNSLVNDWLDSFRTNLLPFIIKYQLPKDL
jgi:hypothetical protein